MQFLYNFQVLPVKPDGNQEGSLVLFSLLEISKLMLYTLVQQTT